MGCTNSLPKTTRFVPEDVLEEVVGSFRDVPPAHFIYKIDSFSQLLTEYFFTKRCYAVDRLDSEEFEAGGYKWKLTLYPKGDKNNNVRDYISVYLAISDTSSLPAGWELNVVFRFFLLDQIRNKYFMIGDVGGRARRFHEMKTEMGFAKLILLESFKDPSSGFLVDDKCVFGAEVLLVPRSTGCGEYLSMVKAKTTVNQVWKIQTYSQIREECIHSEAFTVANYTWNVNLYPKGVGEGKNNSISLYLTLADSSSTNLASRPKVYIHFKLLLKDQKSGKYVTRDAKHRFSASSKECGWEKFMELCDLTDKAMSFLVNDTIIVESEITVLGSFRDVLPTHFTFKIESFSVLSKSSIQKYESNAFEAGGYKWKLSLYPNGNIEENGRNHISLYLEIVKTNSLPRGWELDVFFRFFLFDQVQDKFLILGDMGGKTRRFHETKTKWGYPRLLPITTDLNDTSNGYLVDDTCVFGAEVFVCKSTGHHECLTMVKCETTVTHTWKIENYSEIKDQAYVFSEVFIAGDHQWKIQLYPKGCSEGKNRSIAMYLRLVGSETPADSVNVTKVYAGYTLRIKNQMDHKEPWEHKGHDHWFCLSTNSNNWGWVKFIKLRNFSNKTKGFLVKDVCIIEAEVTVLAVVKELL